MISTPDAKLDSEPCNAKPTAKPAAPKIAMNDVVSIPICESAISTVNANTNVYTILATKEPTALSTCFFANPFSVKLEQNLETLLPIKKIISATTA